MAEAPITTLSAGLAVAEILGELLPGKVFPLYADFRTTKPCIVYQREGIEVARDKDGIAIEECHLSLYIITARYAEGVALAERCRAELEGAPASVLRRHELDTIELDGADEYSESDTSTFIQQLTIRLSRRT